MPHFTFTTSVYKGRTEREFDVSVTYQVTDAGDIEVTDAKADCHLTDEDFEHFYDIACDNAAQDMAEWRAEYGEYLADLRDERRAA